MASAASQITAFSAVSSQYQSTLASSGIVRETFQDRMTQTRNWLYHPEEGTVMGRTLLDWLLVVGFIFAFLVALLGMSAVFCGLLYWVIDWNYPTLQGASTILQAPGMSFRPQPDVTSTLVRFVKGDGSTYNHYLDHIEAYIQYYENELQTGDSYAECSKINGRRTTELRKACTFQVKLLGDDCVKQQNYGYDDGQPCILLKLNKIFEWVPEEYTNDTVPDELRGIWGDNMWIYIICDGDDPATREYMGSLTISPANGFHFKYFPFLNQQSYRSPLAFLRFENPHPGILFMMTCKAYARNIIHDRSSMVGQVHFEVMVD